MQMRTTNITADATVEVQKCLGEPNIGWLENRGGLAIGSTGTFPGRETCIGSAHSTQLQTQQRGDDWPSGLSV